MIHGLDGGGPISSEDPRRLALDDWPAGEHLGRLGGWGDIDGVGGPDLVVSLHGGSYSSNSNSSGEPAQILVYFDPGPE